MTRTLEQQKHAEKVHELLQFDFLYMGESAAGYEYNLILNGDLSGYVFLVRSQMLIKLLRYSWSISQILSQY